VQFSIGVEMQKDTEKNFTRGFSFFGKAGILCPLRVWAMSMLRRASENLSGIEAGGGISRGAVLCCGFGRRDSGDEGVREGRSRRGAVTGRHLGGYEMRIFERS